MVSPKLRLTDQFSDASTEHTCSFIFYWLFAGLLCQVLYQNRMWENRVKIDFHTIVMKHCISKFINSKMEKSIKIHQKAQKCAGLQEKNLQCMGLRLGSSGIVQRRCLMVLSNGAVKQCYQTVLSNGNVNGVVKQCQTKLLNGVVK